MQVPVDLEAAANSTVSFTMDAPIESQRAVFSGALVRGAITTEVDRLEPHHLETIEPLP